MKENISIDKDKIKLKGKGKKVITKHDPTEAKPWDELGDEYVDVC